MKIIPLQLLLTILMVSQSLSNWKVVNTNPNYELRSIYFADSLLGWTAGNGVILKTNDGGKKWNVKQNVDGTGIDEIQFSGRNIGFAVGWEAKALKSTDGGESWNSLGNVGLHNWGLHMIDSNNIVVAGHSRILKSTNSGSSWTQFDDVSGFQSVHFANNEVGWAAGGRVCKTTNAGESWEIQLGLSAHSVFVTNANNVYMVASNGVHRSTNGGISWTSQTVGTGNLWGIYFPTTTLGYTCGTGKVFKTTNGGNSWVNKPTNFDIDLLDVFFATNDIGYVCGKNGTILKTTNGGDDWILSSTGLNFYDIRVIDSTKIVAVGQSGAIFKTTDAGNTWRSKSSGTFEDIFNVNYLNSSLGWIVAAKGVIRKTTNGGDTWEAQESGTAEDLSQIYFFNNNTGWIVGKSSTVLKTTNGGTSWFTQNLPDVNYLQKVQFVNENTGWIVGDFGSIYKTTNGGTNWTFINSGYTNHLNHLYFFDTQNGFVLGGDGLILKTTNGGTSWSQINTGLSEHLTSINFLNSKNGVIVGSSGIILSTSDGGLNWSKDTLSNKNNLWAVSSYNSNNIWVAGSNGNIARSQKISLPTISTNEISEISKNSAITGGNVTNDGGEIITERGVCWSTSQNPTIANYKTVNGSGVGSFISNITSLQSGTKYYVRAYATNTDGTAYGDQKSFITLLESPILSSPESNATDVAITPSFQWSSVNNATRYDLQVATNENFTSPIIDQSNITTTTFEGSGLSNGTQYFWRVRALNDEQTGDWSSVWMFTTSSLSSVKQIDKFKNNYLLLQNYPNPMNKETTIEFVLPIRCKVQILVYNHLGNVVSKLIESDLEAGKYEVNFCADSLPSGLYYYQLNSGSFSNTKSLIILR